MGIIDRIILSIYTFLLTFLSLGVILISLRLISLDFVWTSISRIHGQWEAGLVGAVFLLISMRFMLAGLRSKGVKDTIVYHNDMGDVHISVGAVENLVEKTARHIKGIRGVKVYVTQSEQTLRVKLKLVVSPESNVPTVTADVQKRVKEYIKNTVGIELTEIEIIVENISNDFKVKQRVE